jgi:tRNA C32,U32 (ribose-2'-O)-methylase TrmJ
MAADGNGEKFIAVKSWQVFLAVLGMAASMLLSYASMKAQTEENTRQIRQIQEETVKKEQLEDIKSRLERIERKIDHEEELRIARQH